MPAPVSLAPPDPVVPPVVAPPDVPPIVAPAPMGLLPVVDVLLAVPLAPMIDSPLTS
jgi:hypothetical protein